MVVHAAHESPTAKLSEIADRIENDESRSMTVVERDSRQPRHLLDPVRISVTMSALIKASQDDYDGIQFPTSAIGIPHL